MSRPYNRFLSYEHLGRGYLAGGFDVRGDLVAANIGNGRVALWDVKRGFILASWGSSRGGFSLTGDSNHVQFADNDDGKALKLLATDGVAMKELAW